MNGLPECSRFWRRVAWSAVAIVGLLAVADALIGVYLHMARRPSTAARKVVAAMNNLIPHPDYIWTYTPGSRTWMAAERILLEASINQDGLRSEPGRPQGRYFLALGDSLTFGWLVALEDTWHKRLAAYLTERWGRPIASVNLGMWMSTFSQHYLRLREMLARYPSPEFVVHLVYPSHVQTIAAHILDYDPAGDLRRTRSLLLHVKNGELYYGADEASVLAREISWPYSLWLVGQRLRMGKFTAAYERLVGPLEKVTDLNIYSGDHAEVFVPAWRMTERSLGATATLLRARGIPYVVAIAPRDLQVAESEWLQTRPDPRILEGNKPQEKLINICRAHGIPCLDLLPAFRQAASRGEALYFPTDPHWTPGGHELAAKKLAEFIGPHVSAAWR